MAADRILVRPDGYVAWADTTERPDDQDGLEHAMRHWFGVDFTLPCRRAN
ncbi:hypothetical protein [Mycolicibacterium mageritense]